MGDVVILDANFKDSCDTLDHLEDLNNIVHTDTEIEFIICAAHTFLYFLHQCSFGSVDIRD